MFPSPVSMYTHGTVTLKLQSQLVEADGNEMKVMQMGWIGIECVLHDRVHTKVRDCLAHEMMMMMACVYYASRSAASAFASRSNTDSPHNASLFPSQSTKNFDRRSPTEEESHPKVCTLQNSRKIKTFPVNLRPLWEREKFKMMISNDDF